MKNKPLTPTLISRIPRKFADIYADMAYYIKPWILLLCGDLSIVENMGSDGKTKQKQQQNPNLFVQ